MAIKSKDVKTVPAGKNDDFEIAVMDINNIIERGKPILKAKGIKVSSAMSLELTEGMSIKAQDGIDHDKIIAFKEKKEKLKNKRELIDFEERKVKLTNKDDDSRAM